MSKSRSSKTGQGETKKKPGSARDHIARLIQKAKASGRIDVPTPPEALKVLRAALDHNDALPTKGRGRVNKQDVIESMRDLGWQGCPRKLEEVCQGLGRRSWMEP